MKQKMKVAFCVPNMIIGGVETVFVNTLTELLKNKDLEIQVISHAKIRETLYVDWFKAHPEIPLHVYYPLHNFFEDLSKYSKIFPLKQLRKIIFSLYKKYRRIFVKLSGKFNKIDIFIDYKNFEFFKELKYYNVPKIAWAHSALSYFESHGSFARLAQYTTIVGITDDFVNEFKAKYPKYADKIVRIYNPMDVDTIIDKSKRCCTPRGKYFCHVSRLSPGKDIKTLLKAFDIFALKHKNVSLYIVGDGPQADEIKKYAEELKSHEQIIFTGSLNNPYCIMSGALANILSSEYEGLPTVVLESVILGVPCISSNCKNGPREILLDGKGGLLFEIGNFEMLAEKMDYLLTHPNKAKNLSDVANKGLKRFEPKVIAKQIVELLKRVK